MWRVFIHSQVPKIAHLPIEIDQVISDRVSQIFATHSKKFVDFVWKPSKFFSHAENIGFCSLAKSKSFEAASSKTCLTLHSTFNFFINFIMNRRTESFESLALHVPWLRMKHLNSNLNFHYIQMLYVMHHTQFFCI